MKKIIKLILGVFAVIIIIVGLGIYKFNYLQDDIFYKGSSINSTDKELFYGSWVETNPINKKEFQGFKLNEDGTASSINMATLKYKSWEIKPGKLILVAKSIGNGISFIDTTAYDIVLIGSYDLEIKYNDSNYIIKYKKK